MIESEEKLTVEEQKEKIRQRYKGVNPDELDFIPATPTENFYEDTTEKRVAVYARVSTDDPRQTSSYELQKNHYMDVIDRHAGWKLMHIYADEYTSYGQNPKRPWIPTISVFTGVFIIQSLLTLPT